MGTVFNGLSHLSAVTERGQFIVGLLRGLGGNLNLKTRQEFAKEVRIPVFFVWAQGNSENSSGLGLKFYSCFMSHKYEGESSFK